MLKSCPADLQTPLIKEVMTCLVSAVEVNPTADGTHGIDTTCAVSTKNVVVVACCCGGLCVFTAVVVVLVVAG